MNLEDYQTYKYYKRVEGDKSFIFRVIRIDWVLHIEPMEEIPAWLILAHVPHQSASMGTHGGMDWYTDFAIHPSDFDVEAEESEVALAALDKPCPSDAADMWYDNIFHRARSLGGRSR